MTPVKTRKHIARGLDQLVRLDPRLKPVIKVSGEVPLRLQKPGFAGLARIVIGQQVSRASAEAIHARFANEITPQTPEAFLGAGEAAWIRIGLSRAKQSTLVGLSNAILNGALDMESLPALPADEAISRMTALKGIGPWTAEVYLLFCAGHPDIFPAGDLALQEAVRHAFSIEKRPTDKELRKISKCWSPQRGIAARLFWAYYKALKQGRDALPL